MKTYFSVLLYLFTAAGANLTLSWIGVWATPILALIFIGLDMSLRDSLHAKWESKYLWLRMSMLILGGSLLSWLINPSSQRICIASGVAFLLSGMTDAGIYALLRGKRWGVKANTSNLFSASVDSITFSLLAFSEIKWIPCSLSILAKVLGGFLYTCLILALFRSIMKRRESIGFLSRYLKVIRKEECIHV